MIRNLLKRYYKLLTLLFLVTISIVSLFPLPELPKVPGNDKTMHLLAYAVLAFPISFIRPAAWRKIILFFLMWSGLMELIQPYVNRTGELNDLLANAGGLCLGILVGRLTDLWILPD